MIVLDLHTMRHVSAQEANIPTVLCLGSFDGVHLGHRALIERAKQEAAVLGAGGRQVLVGVFCFIVPPKVILSGEKTPQINSLREKLHLFSECGVDRVYLGDFARLRDVLPEMFIREVLMDTCHAAATVCGFNFRFGRGGSGTPEDLQAVFGNNAHTVDAVLQDGEPISSTRIRMLLEEGQTEAACRMMGHNFLLEAPVVHGKALGRTIGLPTANQCFPRQHVIPSHGIYATKVETPSGVYVGVTNVGIRPTVHDGFGVNSETFILDFNETLYGEVIRTSFYHKLRDEKQFENLEALRTAIRADGEAAGRYFAEGRDKQI